MVWECGPEARVRRRVSRSPQGHRSRHPRLRSYQALCDTDKGQEVHTTRIARGTRLAVVGNNENYRPISFMSPISKIH